MVTQRVLLDGGARRKLQLSPHAGLLLVFVVDVFIVNKANKRTVKLVHLILYAIPTVLLLASGRYTGTINCVTIFSTFCTIRVCILPRLAKVLGFLILFAAKFFYQVLPDITVTTCTIGAAAIDRLVSNVREVRVPGRIAVPLAIVFHFFPAIFRRSRTVDSTVGVHKVGLKKGGSSGVLRCGLVPVVAYSIGVNRRLSTTTVAHNLNTPIGHAGVYRLGFGFTSIILVLFYYFMIF